MANNGSADSRPIAVLLGPTCSGKTTMAIAIAERVKARGRKLDPIGGELAVRSGPARSACPAPEQSPFERARAVRQEYDPPVSALRPAGLVLQDARREPGEKHPRILHRVNPEPARLPGRDRHSRSAGTCVSSIERS